MAYYPDLTPYEYDHDLGALSARLDEVRERCHSRRNIEAVLNAIKHIEALLNAVNIGWLRANHPHSTGDTTANFQGSLLKFCLDPPWGHRGLHYCGLGECSGRREPIRAGERGRSIRLGAGVIIVAGCTRTYAAPNLIYHYVVAHGYRPPDEFIDAVLASKPPVTHRSRTGRLAFLRRVFGSVLKA